jgi:hypothetical protein
MGFPLNDLRTRAPASRETRRGPRSYPASRVEYCTVPARCRVLLRGTELGKLGSLLASQLEEPAVLASTSVPRTGPGSVRTGLKNHLRHVQRLVPGALSLTSDIVDQSCRSRQRCLE